MASFKRSLIALFGPDFPCGMGKAGELPSTPPSIYFGQPKFSLRRVEKQAHNCLYARVSTTSKLLSANSSYAMASPTLPATASIRGQYLVIEVDRESDHPKP